MKTRGLYMNLNRLPASEPVAVMVLEVRECGVRELGHVTTTRRHRLWPRCSMDLNTVYGFLASHPSSHSLAYRPRGPHISPFLIRAPGETEKLPSVTRPSFCHAAYHLRRSRGDPPKPTFKLKPCFFRLGIFHKHDEKLTAEFEPTLRDLLMCFPTVLEWGEH